MSVAGGCRITGSITSSLNLFIEDTVFSYQGLGPWIRMTQSDNADPSQSGMFGKGWSFAYESSTSQTCTEATLKKGSGATLKYTATLCSGGNPATPPVEATPPEGQHDRLTWYGEYWLLVEKATFRTYRYDKVSGTSRYLLSSITDANGNAVQITYNTDKTIKKITDAASRATTFSYDSSKRCTAMTTPDGRQATYHYDANGNLSGTTDLAGYATVYTYDGNNYLATMAAAGKTMSFSYDESGGYKLIASVTNAGGKTTQYQVGLGSPRTIQSTDPRGGITTYGSSNNLTSTVTNPLNQTTSTSYSMGHPATSTNALGGVTQTEYDARGNLTKLTDPLGRLIPMCMTPTTTSSAKRTLSGRRGRIPTIASTISPKKSPRWIMKRS